MIPSLNTVIRELKDPIQFARAFWPDVHFYNKQREIIYSVRDNYETDVVAGNKLGKDFVAGFIVVWFFLTRHPVRIVTTSADYSQLESVLWGEIRRFLQTSRIPLTADKGGPIVENHLHLRKIHGGNICGVSYAIGRVAKKGEGMLGHHVTPTPTKWGLKHPPKVEIPRTLFVADEASGVDDLSYERATTWAERILAIGNPFPCNNFYRRNIKDGDLYIEDLKNTVKKGSTNG